MASTNSTPCCAGDTFDRLGGDIGRERAHALIDDSAPDDNFWCRELDQTWSLRTVETIRLKLTPGQWKYASTGYPYWERLFISVVVSETIRKTNS